MRHTIPPAERGRALRKGAAKVRPPLLSDDPLLIARESAIEVGLSLPTFWRAVRNGRMPAPFYPSPRAPRWRRSELRTALEGLRLQPTDALAQRMGLRRGGTSRT